MAFASLACPAGCGVSTDKRRQPARPIDALLIDETIDMPSLLAASINAGSRTLPVVGVRLDAANHSGLRRILDESHAIVGISSGATLFCVERIAWDHGFRLTGRSERSASARGDDALRRYVDALLGGARVPATDPSPVARAYRPSRVDGTLHAWVMHKSGREA